MYKTIKHIEKQIKTLNQGSDSQVKTLQSELAALKKKQDNELALKKKKYDSLQSKQTKQINEFNTLESSMKSLKQQHKTYVTSLQVTFANEKDTALAKAKKDSDAAAAKVAAATKIAVAKAAKAAQVKQPPTNKKCPVHNNDELIKKHTVEKKRIQDACQKNIASASEESTKNIKQLEVNKLSITKSEQVQKSLNEQSLKKFQKKNKLAEEEYKKEMSQVVYKNSNAAVAAAAVKKDLTLQLKKVEIELKARNGDKLSPEDRKLFAGTGNCIPGKFFFGSNILFFLE